MSLQPPRPGRAGPRGPCGSARRSQPGPAGGGGGARTAAAPGGAGGLSTGPGPAGGSRGRLSRGPRSWAGAGAPRRLRETRRFLRGWASCRSGLGYQPWATAPVTLTCSGIYCKFLLMTGRGNNKSPPRFMWSFAAFVARAYLTVRILPVLSAWLEVWHWLASYSLAGAATQSCLCLKYSCLASRRFASFLCGFWSYFQRSTTLQCCLQVPRAGSFSAWSQ